MKVNELKGLRLQRIYAAIFLSNFFTHNEEGWGKISFTLVSYGGIAFKCSYKFCLYSVEVYWNVKGHRTAIEG